jgi:hypothetical protein
MTPTQTSRAPISPGRSSESWELPQLREGMSPTPPSADMGLET